MSLSAYIIGNRERVAGSVAIGSVVQHQAFQRDVPFTVNGTYTVSAGVLRYVQVRFNGGAWQTLDAAPSGGSYSGTISPPAGVGTLEVRLNRSSTAASVANVLVGEVFAIMGQSNADGQGTNLQTYSGTTAKEFRAGAWSPLADPVGQNSVKGSPYPQLASLLETSLGVPVAFVVGDTAGGTSLYLGDWSPGGDQYENTVVMVNAAATNRIRAILWYQGERDAIQGRTQSQYQTALSAMLDGFQSECPALATSKLLATVIGPSNVAASLDNIRLAVINRWENDSDILPGPVAHASFNPADQLHWATNAELERLAKMWARTILGNFFAGESPRGPRLLSTDVGTAGGLLATQVRVTFTGGVGSLVNGTDLDGWAVSDYNGARTVVSASASGSVVTLTCDQDLVDAVTLSYAAGETGETSSLLDSGTLVGLPPEPIINYAAGMGIAVDPLLQNLLGWYTLDEASGQRNDSHTTARHLTDNNTVGSTTGKIGNAASFVAANTESLSRGSDITAALGTGFSVSLWFKTSASATQVLFAKAPGLNANGQFVIYIGSTGVITVRVIGSGSYIGRATAAGYNNGAWRHLVVTYDGTTASSGVKIFVDNTQVDTGNSQSGTFTAIYAATANLALGATNLGTSPLTGDLDEAAWWNKALTLSDIAALYNGGAGITYDDI